MTDMTDTGAAPAPMAGIGLAALPHTGGGARALIVAEASAHIKAQIQAACLWEAEKTLTRF